MELLAHYRTLTNKNLPSLSINDQRTMASDGLQAFFTPISHEFRAGAYLTFQTQVDGLLGILDPKVAQSFKVTHKF